MSLLPPLYTTDIKSPFRYKQKSPCNEKRYRDEYTRGSTLFGLRPLFSMLAFTNRYLRSCQCSTAPSTKCELTPSSLAREVYYSASSHILYTILQQYRGMNVNTVINLRNLESNYFTYKDLRIKRITLPELIKRCQLLISAQNIVHIKNRI